MKKFIRDLKIKRYTNKVRKQAKAVKGFLKVNHFSRVNKNTVIGHNVHMNGVKVQGSGEVIIGDNVHFGENILIMSSDHDYDHGDTLPYGNTYIHRKIVIEDNVWIGSNVIILGNTTLKEGCIIQAGSVVVKDVEKGMIAGGHPAKAFKSRDMDHYEKLKKEGKFI